MKDLVMNYVVGEKTKQLFIKFLAHGAGHIMMDRYFHGQVVFSQSQWRVYLADKSELNNCDDIQALIQLLNDRSET
jgi:hypothetical protein